jgi:hypothetical protein
VKIGSSCCHSTQPARCRPAAVIQFAQLSAGTDLHRIHCARQAGNTSPARVSGFDKHTAITANNAGNLGLSQVALRRIKILIEQFALFPTALLRFFSNG